MITSIVLIALAILLLAAVLFLCGVAAGVYLSTGAASLDRLAEPEDTGALPLDFPLTSGPGGAA